MRKYQFCIRFTGIDVNSAATKAVSDCNEIFAQHGFSDYTFSVTDNRNKLVYYLKLIRKLTAFFMKISSGSLVGVQYPLLSINEVFRYFIKVARLKGVRFFCIIHDLESLRTGGKDEVLIRREISNLSCYDIVISHNASMSSWLKTHGLVRKVISLDLFDYLLKSQEPAGNTPGRRTIVFAGNLGKSTFIYKLHEFAGWNFNLYGSNFDAGFVNRYPNLHWAGSFDPQHIAAALEGDFGLIWDGAETSHTDAVLGNYMRYNNPHKCSLYIAAGLPLIAPKNSAIGRFILSSNIGFLVDSLEELQSVEISQGQYDTMKENVLRIRPEVISGKFFGTAIQSIEKTYAAG
ncbi:hypothetical protein [Pedobacter sp. SYP-B3415]|uniref:hypothetical protein n=1 Tax=Pedobacter sp. SYP-B3415 TaxID=2496641 RepID=UPI00101BA3F2|nr:hypothetical protein [Pedobacter sp. SYP-B3415]